MKYTFTCEDEYSNWKNSTEFYAESLDEVLENFGYFLKGSTFHIDGEIDIVNNEIESIEDNVKSNDLSKWSHIVDSLSKYSNDDKKDAKCQICELPLDIMARHDCYQPGCPLVQSL